MEGDGISHLLPLGQKVAKEDNVHKMEMRETNDNDNVLIFVHPETGTIETWKRLSQNNACKVIRIVSNYQRLQSVRG